MADFGVARVQAQSGIMTAETGTYRWMAPEVIQLLMLLSAMHNRGPLAEILKCLLELQRQ